MSRTRNLVVPFLAVNGTVKVNDVVAGAATWLSVSPSFSLTSFKVPFWLKSIQAAKSFSV